MLQLGPRREWLRREEAYLRNTGHAMYAVANAPCKTCRTQAATRLVRLTCRAGPHKRQVVPQHTRLSAATRALHTATMLKAGESVSLCPGCTPMSRATPLLRRHARDAAHAKAALIAILGGRCALCASTTDLVLDQTVPPGTRIDSTTPGVRQRPALLASFRYYAALAKAGHAQVLCRSCNSRVTAQRPGWLQGLADARRALTAVTNQK